MNKISRTIILISLLLVVMGTIVACSKNHEKETHEPESYSYKDRKNLQCLHYNKTDFINIPDYAINQDAATIRGCIVPHHLLAKDLIHEVFQNVSKDKYKTVVLMGPDHESADMGKIFTSLSNWQTPTGILQTDREITEELLKNSFVIENDDKLTVEHSTSSIIPFIKYYLEDVKVVTLVLTKQVKLEDASRLVDSLYENINIEETLFIGSVDFSHYLNLDQANEMDLISMAAIENKDINTIMSFTNDNLDSPITIVTMLSIMDRGGIGKRHVLNHSNSELILEKPVEETTSYISYLFY